MGSRKEGFTFKQFFLFQCKTLNKNVMSNNKQYVK